MEIIRTLYTHALTTEPVGTREDGTTYERFRVIMPEDLKESVMKLWDDGIIAEIDKRHLWEELGIEKEFHEDI